LSSLLCPTLPLFALLAANVAFSIGDAPTCTSGICAGFEDSSADDQDLSPFLQTKQLNIQGTSALAGRSVAKQKHREHVPFQKFVEEVPPPAPTFRFKDVQAVLTVERFQAMLHSAAVFFIVAIFCLGTQLLVTECLDTCFQIDPFEAADWLMGRCRDSSKAVHIMAASMRLGGSWSQRAFQGLRRWLAACLCLRRHQPLECEVLDLAAASPTAQEIASFLEPEDICRWGCTSQLYRSLPDEFCSYPVLLKELQRMDAEPEWLTRIKQDEYGDECQNSEEMAAEFLTQAKQADAIKPTPSMMSALRSFLGESRRRRSARERAEALGRCHDVLSDIFRCLLLVVCWLSFFCQVIGLAESPPSSTSMSSLSKALVSPAIFLFVLEAVDQHLGRASIAGAIAAFLLIDCVLTGHCHGNHCGQQHVAEFHSFAQRLSVR